MAPVEREIVLVSYQSKKRPAIIFELLEGHAWVAIGTGTHRPEYPSLKVAERSRDATNLSLYKDTYFYPSNYVLVKRNLLERPGPMPRQCPPGLFLRLRAFFEEHCSLMAKR